jgi:hypothetical protein
MKSLIKGFFYKIGYQISKINKQASKMDIYLHKYKNYEEYKKVQIKFNKLKIDNVWADNAVLSCIVNFLKKNRESESKLFGLCHGSRNGYEQNYLAKEIGLPCKILGTDISPTANKFSNSIVHDFHDQRKDWLNKMDFVYSNSLDQSFDPERALSIWLAQVKVGGFLIIELSLQHEPNGASEMDPFGIKCEYFPYFLIKLFSHNVTIHIENIKKSNGKGMAFIFFIKKVSDFVS